MILGSAIKKKKKDSTDAKKDSKLLKLEHKLLLNKDHKLPDINDFSFETKLKKVATKGIVKLFNAIKSHHLTKEVSNVTRSKTDDVTKEKFMELLKSSNKPENKNSEKAPTKLIKEKKAPNIPSWEILRDDYMLDAKLKDWNKTFDE